MKPSLNMGLCESLVVDADLREATKVNREIEKDLAKDKPTMLHQTVLLLGPGESGKSTVLKQIRAMSGTYTRSELEEKRLQIIKNFQQFSEMMLSYARENYLDLSDEENKLFDNMCYELENTCTQEDRLSASLAKTLETFWRTGSIQEAYEKRNLFHMTDSAGYFFENLNRIQKADYVPTNMDIVHIRVATTGIVQVDCVLKNIKLTLCDCGGQRSERRKWYHFFEDTNAVLFVAALSEFDQKLVEDENANRMEEAIRLYWTVFNGKFFKKAAVILFLNKIDIFEKKLKKVQIRDYFPKFKGENTVKDGALFFQRQFKKGLPDGYQKRMYTHETCAISDKLQLIINTVIDTVVQENLKDTGMI